MEYKPNVNEVIRDFTERAITCREVMRYMTEIGEPVAYGEWSAKWCLYTDILSALTGRDTTDCMTKQDYLDILKSLEEPDEK